MDINIDIYLYISDIWITLCLFDVMIFVVNGTINKSTIPYNGNQITSFKNEVYCIFSEHSKLMLI